MHIRFFKYQGTGNDFIIIDNRQQSFDKNNAKLIASMCDRRFGIGADGLILLEPHDTADFRMVYFNSDGNESSMCGNGGRCIVQFAMDQSNVKDQAVFEAVDGRHYGLPHERGIALSMNEVSEVQRQDNNWILNTGSPHYVVFTEGVKTADLIAEARRIRYSPGFAKKGINVNLVEAMGENAYYVRTYERGVEDETLSCGTGVTAVAIAAVASGRSANCPVLIQTPGGELEINFDVENQVFRNIRLIGPAQLVFEGNWIW